MTNKEIEKLYKDQLDQHYLNFLEWEQLTDKQKHDVVMILAKDFQNKSPAVGL